jgi:hypothetical protein
MDEDPKISEIAPRGRKIKVAFEPQDWVGLALAISALGALVVAVIATKAVSKKAAPASTETAPAGLAGL